MMQHFVEGQEPGTDLISRNEKSWLFMVHPVFVMITVPIIGLAYVLLLPITVTATVIGLGLTRIIGDMFS